MHLQALSKKCTLFGWQYSISRCFRGYGESLPEIQSCIFHIFVSRRSTLFLHRILLRASSECTYYELGVLLYLCANNSIFADTHVNACTKGDCTHEHCEYHKFDLPLCGAPPLVRRDHMSHCRRAQPFDGIDVWVSHRTSIRPPLTS